MSKELNQGLFETLFGSALTLTSTLINMSAFGAGFYRGLYDLNRIPIQNQTLEWMLTYGPAIIQGTVSAVGEAFELKGRTSETTSLLRNIPLGEAYNQAMDEITKTKTARVCYTWISGATLGGILTILGYYVPSLLDKIN